MIAIVVLAFFMQAVIHESTSGDFFRLIPIAMIAFVASYNVAMGRVSFSGFRPGIVDLMFFVFVVISVVPVFFDGVSEPLIFSMLLVLTAYSGFVVLVAYGVEKVTYAFLISAFLAFGYALFTDFYGYVDGLTAARTEYGLLRYMAFGAHPNLIAHNFSFAAVAAVVCGLFSKSTLLRLFFFGVFLCLFSMPVAASSRGGVLAGVVGLFFISLHFYLNRNNAEVGLRWVGKALPLVFVAVPFVVAINFEFFFDLFELGSDYRGIGSGGTGRLTNWFQLVDMVFSSPRVLLLGAGFRSWADFGFSVDSSYFNMLWEVGLPVAIFSFVVPIFIFVRFFNQKPTFVVVLLVGLFGFMLFEAFVARYFYGVGNPATTLFMALLVYASHKKLS